MVWTRFGVELHWTRSSSKNWMNWSVVSERTKGKIDINWVILESRFSGMNQIPSPPLLVAVCQNATRAAPTAPAPGFRLPKQRSRFEFSRNILEKLVTRDPSDRWLRRDKRPSLTLWAASTVLLVCCCLFNRFYWNSFGWLSCKTHPSREE